MKTIREIASKLAIADEFLDYYGNYTAKLKLELLRAPAGGRPGRLILVTAATPTRHGEGKTVVSIGLAEALERSGHRAIVTLREPSLGPVFGEKGGATGGGRAEVLPAEKINLHFNGDFSALTAAHNLLAAMIDAHIHHGNGLAIDIDNCFWPRAIDMNDRALRHIVIGLGGKANGLPRETSFVITAASEVMAILALAVSRPDLRSRLNDIVIGYNREGRVVRAADLGAAGAMMVLLNDAIMPNLVQTSEHTAAIVHAGPFANIAHGTSSVLAQQMALKLADYAINETGFAADLGVEKYIDIVTRTSGIKPAAAVIVVTHRALSVQGLPNLARHFEILRTFELPFVVAINRFPEDADGDIAAVAGFCQQGGVESAVVDAYQRGGEGALELAEKVIVAADKANEEEIQPLYGLNLTLEEKIETVAQRIYGAASIHLELNARRKLKKYADLGFGSLPVCIAKTPYSFSDNAKLLGAPTGWQLTVTDAYLAAGAGFVVVTAGDMLLMPGLPAIPNAVRMNVDDNGKITGW